MNENKPNRLINEKSPYLLQHAYNPVDWYPWNNEAFEKAEKENKLILLSIGYSTCHWCHVMAYGAFSDERTANCLNEHFVSIKVDKEERPDLDEIYMLSCQLLSGECGWPLNTILTPDKKPVFAGTYFPAKETFERTSFLKILEKINDVWINDKSKVFEISDLISDKIREVQNITIKENISKDTLQKAFNIFSREFDSKYGGFGSAPKFPSPHNLSFLLRWYKTSGDKKALDIVEKTLTAMFLGGIFDHIGGGFHRYSTDKKWMIPHFEKMLYDQALIATAYIEAFQITGNELYAYVAKRTLDFVLRELTSPDGGFYSGVDADIEGEEGKFYVWSKEDILKILGFDAELFCEFYGITKTGNFEPDKNVLHIPLPQEEFTRKFSLNKDEFYQKISNSITKLYEIRSQRPNPHIDDKIITSWNGLMIKALALAGKIFEEDKYNLAAIKAGEFILEHLADTEGKLSRSYRNGRSNIPGFIEDYAFFIYGLLELYQATFDTIYLKLSLNFADKMIDDFYDDKDGGFFLTSYNAETSIARVKDATDEAMPSGNSIAALILLELSDISENENYAELAQEVFTTFGFEANQSPTEYSQFLTALIYSLGKHRTFLIAENPNDKDTDKIIKSLNQRLFTDSIVLYKRSDNPEIQQIYTSAKNKNALDQKTEIYICEKTTCKQSLKGLHAVEYFLDENKI